MKIDARWCTVKFLSVVLLCALPTGRAFAQGPCSQVSGKADNGATWNSWSDPIRGRYLLGYVEGYFDTYARVMADLSPTRLEEVRQQTFIIHDVDTIMRVMTDLYRDPANTYITHGAMIYIARDKISGYDIEARLRRSRQYDCSIPASPQ